MKRTEYSFTRQEINYLSKVWRETLNPEGECTFTIEVSRWGRNFKTSFQFKNYIPLYVKYCLVPKARMPKIYCFLSPSRSQSSEEVRLIRKQLDATFMMNLMKYPFNCFLQYPPTVLLSILYLILISVNLVNKDCYGQFSPILWLLYLSVQLSCNISFKALFNTDFFFFA